MSYSVRKKVRKLLRVSCIEISLDEEKEKNPLVPV